MAMDEIPTVEELAEATGQSEEQLRRDQEALSRVAPEPDADEE
ncbi:hypothetical protein Halxa_2316 [Halopiger xanaduensis SH-6]|uniref:Uncharacterized protein n=1 Tax=Halopiger xanaduensis (strain DSM 18323 / JCM 14033 / SH-6) TaxID=797210 RepID=F8DA24_HALXS|nr:hypothetical protein Halxa_2316 [Halopiger xanaduensis SH-6]